MKSFHHTILMTTLVIVFIGCTKEPTNSGARAYALQAPGFPAPAIGDDNPLTYEGVYLGRMLFYETLLSADNSMSCASCHNQKTAFSDTSQFSIGVEGLPGGRQAMAVFNMAWNKNGFFWDGRAQLLRHQSLMPIQDPLEMNETLENVVAKLEQSDTYSMRFNYAFGSPEITAERISLALEQFMSTIVSNRSRYDAYLAGDAVLTEQEERGRFLFFTEFNPQYPLQSGADCGHCHGGANFENDKYMNNGLDAVADLADPGRMNVTGNAADNGKFKVPSLRNIELTHPYMHDGRFNTLEEVVEHYNLPVNSALLDPLFNQQMPAGLLLPEADKAALVAFLKTLTDHALTEDLRWIDPH